MHICPPPGWYRVNWSVKNRGWQAWRLLFDNRMDRKNLPCSARSPESFSIFDLHDSNFHINLESFPISQISQMSFLRIVRVLNLCTRFCHRLFSISFLKTYINLNHFQFHYTISQISLHVFNLFNCQAHLRPIKRENINSWFLGESPFRAGRL